MRWDNVWYWRTLLWKDKVLDKTNSEVLINVNILDELEWGEDWDETTRYADEIRDSEDQIVRDVNIVVIEDEGWVVFHNEDNDVVITLDNVVMSNEDMIEEL